MGSSTSRPIGLSGRRNARSLDRDGRVGGKTTKRVSTRKVKDSTVKSDPHLRPQHGSWVPEGSTRFSPDPPIRESVDLHGFPLYGVTPVRDVVPSTGNGRGPWYGRDLAPPNEVKEV